MAWLQVHQTLKDHRKLFDAADELEITPPHMMGLLVSFWLWALDNAPSRGSGAARSAPGLSPAKEVPRMNKATCRGCGAPIVWIKTPAGKAMPCDPAPVYYKATPDGKDKVVTTRGEVVSCEIVPGANATDAGYRPHWATCPQADRFKRGGRHHE